MAREDDWYRSGVMEIIHTRQKWSTVWIETRGTTSFQIYIATYSHSPTTWLVRDTSQMPDEYVFLIYLCQNNIRFTALFVFQYAEQGTCIIRIITCSTWHDTIHTSDSMLDGFSPVLTCSTSHDTIHTLDSMLDGFSPVLTCSTPHDTIHTPDSMFDGFSPVLTCSLDTCSAPTYHQGMSLLLWYWVYADKVHGVDYNNTDENYEKHLAVNASHIPGAFGIIKKSVMRYSSKRFPVNPMEHHSAALLLSNQIHNIVIFLSVIGKSD